MNRSKTEITGFGLKMIAVITMLIDHTAAIVVERLMIYNGYAYFDSLYPVYLLMRGIGRMAFPIYLFLLVEGFHYTKSRKKYALRLFLFFLISEVPFDIAFRRSFFDLSYNNVYLTLLLGLAAMWLAEWVEHTYENNLIVRILLSAAAVAAAAVAAKLMHTDYGAGGVLAAAAMYFLYGRNMGKSREAASEELCECALEAAGKRCESISENLCERASEREGKMYPPTREKAGKLCGFALGVLVLAVFCGRTELAALLMLVPIGLYNGSRGRQAKYLFYAFYPAHLVVLEFICVAAHIPLLK